MQYHGVTSPPTPPPPPHPPPSSILHHHYHNCILLWEVNGFREIICRRNIGRLFKACLFWNNPVSRNGCCRLNSNCHSRWVYFWWGLSMRRLKLDYEMMRLSNTRRRSLSPEKALLLVGSWLRTRNNDDDIHLLSSSWRLWISKPSSHFLISAKLCINITPHSPYIAPETLLTNITNNVA